MASKTFTSGLAGIWYQWLWLFCTPFYWLIAPVMRRFRAITLSDVFEARYARSVGMLFAVVGTFSLMFNIGVMLKGSGSVLSASLGGDVSPNVIILVMTGLFVTYGIAGGLSAAIVTDFIQGILTVIFSFALVPFVLHAVGGFSGLRETVADESMFSLTAPGDITVFYIVVIAFNALIGIVAQPHTMGNCAAGRTESDGRFGFTVGNFIKRICTMAWCVVGIAAVGYLAGREVAPDEVYGLMAHEFFPNIMPGLLGIFIASLLASVMSSCDSFMIASSALFTENLYKPLCPNRSTRHYLLVGRITSGAIVAGGLLSAYLLTDVVAGDRDLLEDLPPHGNRLLAGTALAARHHRRRLGLHPGGLRHLGSHGTGLLPQRRGRGRPRSPPGRRRCPPAALADDLLPQRRHRRRHHCQPPDAAGRSRKAGTVL